MARKANNGPSFTKAPAKRRGVKWGKRTRSFVKGSSSKKVGNLKRWSKW